MWDLIVSVPDHCLPFYHDSFKREVSQISYPGPLTVFALKKIGGGGWLLASPILITFVLGTSNKGQGVWLPAFPIVIICILETSSYAKMVNRK